MKIEKEFTLARPRDEVWAFFNDVPAVAACMPGATYTGQGEDGKYQGKVTVKVGPFQAAFEGAADITWNDTDRVVQMTGKGVDKRGASRGKMSMTCHVIEAGDQTRVTVDADVQLSGSIAQFGRTGIIQEVAGTLIDDFVRNVEDTLPAEGESAPDPQSAPAAAGMAAADDAKDKLTPKPAGNSVNGLRLVWMTVKSLVRRVAGRSNTG